MPEVPNGYRAPRRNYIDIREGAYEGTRPDRYTQYATDRGREARSDREYARRIQRIDEVENAGEIVDATLIVVMNRRTDPTFTARLVYHYVDGNGDVQYAEYECTDSYEDVAIGRVLSMSPEFQRLGYQYIEENGASAGDAVVYHRPYSEPYYDGRVGLGAIKSSLRRMGFSMESRYYGDRERAWTITRTAPYPSASLRSMFGQTRRPAPTGTGRAATKTAAKASKPKTAPKKAPAKTATNAKKTTAKSASCRSKASAKSKGVRR